MAWYPTEEMEKEECAEAV